MAEPPGHCRTIALQRQHVGKAPGIKAGTSELPVLDARLWAWPDPVPSPTPLHLATTRNRDKTLWSEPLPLLRKKNQHQGTLWWQVPRGVPCLQELAEQIKVVFFQRNDQRG